MKYTLNVITLTRDHGDGSSSTYLYNSMEDLLNEHRLSEELIYGENGEKIRELTEQEKKDIIKTIHNDPYEYGNIGKDSIELELIDGFLRLAKPTSIYGNQQ